MGHKTNETKKQDAPKRSLAIAKELAMLTTNLPVSWHSSIFLRVDESRVDCLKAMIIGPEGTPYENGCFLFDVFLVGTSMNPLLVPHGAYDEATAIQFILPPSSLHDDEWRAIQIQPKSICERRESRAVWGAF